MNIHELRRLATVMNIHELWRPSQAVGTGYALMNAELVG